MKSIWLVLIFTLICSTTFAQKKLSDAASDSLESEILKMLNETKWVYYYFHSDKIKGGIKKVIGEIKIENKSLVLNFKKNGIQTISLVDNRITCNDKNPNSGVFITTNWGSKDGWGLSIIHPHKVTTENQFSEETKQTKKQSWKLYELIRTYHDKFDEVAIKTAKEFEEFALNRAKELKEFQSQFQKQQEHTAKSTITEDQRKFIVQANAKNEAKNYFAALKLYEKAIEVNPFSYPSAYYNMALIAAQLNHYSDAIFNMKKYLILEPNAPDARVAQDKIYEWELFIGK